MPVRTLRPIVVRPFGRPGWCGKFAVIVAGADVRARADVGVADVREVRHLRPFADMRVLDLHEGARLGARLERRAGAKVTERARRSHRSPISASTATACGPISAPAATRVRPAQDRERVDVQSGSSSTSGSIQVEAGSTIVTPASMCAALIRSRSDGRGGGELGARVHALGLGRVGRGVRADALAGRRRGADRVGQVELALRVVRLEPLERGPEVARAEDVDRGVHLADRELLRRRVERPRRSPGPSRRRRGRRGRRRAASAGSKASTVAAASRGPVRVDELARAARP